MEKTGRSVYIINIVTIALVIAIAAFSVYVYKKGVFTDADSFVAFVRAFGIWAALLFILLQVASVVVSILPTSIGCIAGIVLFGPWLGFLYNYVGICIGSLFAFLLSKRYGSPFVQKIVGRRMYDKYSKWIENGKKFEKMFALAIFFPVAPDDLFCYMAGLTKMKYSKFLTIIVLGKPFSLALYSLGLTAVIHFVTTLLH